MSDRKIKFTVPMTLTEPKVDPTTPLTLEISIGKDDEGHTYWIPLNHLYPEIRQHALMIYNNRKKLDDNVKVIAGDNVRYKKL